MMSLTPQTKDDGPMLKRFPFPSLSSWNRPELQDAPSPNPESSQGCAAIGNFLTSDHRDSWNPSWNGACGGYSVASGNYDFLMA